MAFVHYDYRFLAADVGVQGRSSDGGVFKNSAMYFALENNKLNLLNPCRLPLTENDESDPRSSSVQFVFVADDAFQLTSYCMKPYGRKNMTDAQRIFDNRLSRKRRVTKIIFQLSYLHHFHYITSSVKDHVIPIRLLVLQTKYTWMAIFAMVLGVTKLVFRISVPSGNYQAKSIQ